MRYLLLLIFFFALFLHLDAQQSSEIDKDWKKSKKIALKNDLKCKVVFCGRTVDNKIKTKLKSDLNWINFVGMETRFSSTGDDCNYCENLNALLENFDRSEVFTLTLESNVVDCIASDFPNYESVDELQNAIITYVLNNKKSLNKLLVILIPPIPQVELNELLAEGWSMDTPKDLGDFDKVTTNTCSGKQVNLYRKKPCSELSNFIQLRWPLDFDFSDESGTKYIFAHKGRSNYFYFYLPIICSDNLKLNLYSNGVRVETFEISPEIDSEIGLMQFNIPITGDDGSEGPHFNDKCEDLVSYELKLCDVSNNKCSDLGSFQFIHCLK
jgi:hypothetical protein